MRSSVGILGLLPVFPVPVSATLFPSCQFHCTEFPVFPLVTPE